MNYKIIKPDHEKEIIGGRIKAASIPIGKILSSNDPEETDAYIKDIIKLKDLPSNLSRFPDKEQSVYNALRKNPLRAYGKTDQGMPGNFYPFIINKDLDVNSIFTFENEIFEALIEPKYIDIICSQTQENILNLLSKKDFSEAYKILDKLPIINEKWGKGKNHFFICRPAETNQIVTIPEYAINVIESKIDE